MQLRKALVFTTSVATIASIGLVAPAVAAPNPDGGLYRTVPATRILDTRSGIGAPKVAVAAHATVTVDATAELGGASVSAVALTVTAVGPVAAGYLTAYPGGTTRPGVSTVNFAAGRATPNATVVPVGSTGAVSIYNGSAGTVNVLADLVGYWTGGPVLTTTAGALNVLTPFRLKDSRLNGGAPLAPLSDTVVPVFGHGGVPSTNVSAAVINLTATNVTAAGYLTASAETQTTGHTSSVNFVAGQTRANLMLVPVNPDGTITIHNGSTSSAAFVVDVTGYFNDGVPAADGSFVPSTPYRALDTRVGGVPLPALTTAKIGLLPDDGTAALFKAIDVTVTVANPQSVGFITAWDGNGLLPPTSNSNFVPGEGVAGTMIVPVNEDGSISIYNGSYGNVDLIIDVAGFVLNDLTLVTAPGLARAAIAKAKTSHPSTTHTHTRTR